VNVAVPPRDRKGLRTGFTTGACSAAAAKAAARYLVRGDALTAIETTLPNRSHATFALARCERIGARARVGVIKDAGDDPDCTHGA
jgi:cobalt-precorrin-5B (C1)-methyltransferase